MEREWDGERREEKDEESRGRGGRGQVEWEEGGQVNEEGEREIFGWRGSEGCTNTLVISKAGKVWN